VHQICGVGFYAWFVNGSFAQCLACPAGVDCLADGSVVAADGIWIDQSGESGLLSAVSCDHCDGDTCGAGEPDWRGPLALTHEGRVNPPSDNPLCGQCLPDYSEW
jgi:hypothetical protein